jgi:hypothetical protein
MGINVQVESERGDAEAQLLDPSNLTAKVVAGCDLGPTGAPLVQCLLTQPRPNWKAAGPGQLQRLP